MGMPVLIVPIAVGVPPVSIFIPPTVIGTPAVLASLLQIMAGMLSRWTVPSMMFHRVMKTMVRSCDTVLTLRLVCTHLSRADESEEEGHGAQRQPLTPVESPCNIHKFSPVVLIENEHSTIILGSPIKGGYTENSPYGGKNPV
jgi:hypothetical protein